MLALMFVVRTNISIRGGLVYSWLFWHEDKAQSSVSEGAATHFVIHLSYCISRKLFTSPARHTTPYLTTDVLQKGKGSVLVNDSKSDINRSAIGMKLFFT